MKAAKYAVCLLCLTLSVLSIHAQTYGRLNDDMRDDRQSRNFNPHNTDTTSQQKDFPRGLHVWTVDRLGDITPATIDTIPHLYPHTTLGIGSTGEYNTTGNNYTARHSRIFANRPLVSPFMFSDCYSQVLKEPDQWHYTNTLSPITNLSYDNCGDKTNGEDHLDARFAANFGKRLGIGFNLDYLYARGYFQNQNNSHFLTDIYASYLGDRYQLHALLTLNHQKVTENGGITLDDYLTHPERYTESYQDNEIPTVLSNNWNRHNRQRLFLTHRYSVGFYRKEKLSAAELRARDFALTDSMRAAMTPQDSLERTMKKVFVPVTSFIHTIEGSRSDRIYQAYTSPQDYYAETFYDIGPKGYRGDSIYDQTRLFHLRNTLAIALLEGFNKYAAAGLKVFAAHELRRYEMPSLTASDNFAVMQQLNEHNVSIGGQLLRQQGHTLHYNVMAETWLAGEDMGQLKIDATGDLNYPLFGDTVRLLAKGHFYRLNPTFLQRNYHSKHFWWDNGSMSKETRTGIEGILTFDRTNTRLRLAVEEIQNYTYLALDYTLTGENRSSLAAAMKQHGGNLSILTAQLDQKLRLGPLHWDNTITCQSSSNKDVLPLPAINVFSNLYLDFMVAHVLKMELGGAVTWFTRYQAPEYCPQLNQFAVQENASSRIELGNFPFVDIYANLHLKHARFFVMLTNATGKSFTRQSFLAPHYPINRSTLHMGISWNFFN